MAYKNQKKNKKHVREAHKFSRNRKHAREKRRNEYGPVFASPEKEKAYYEMLLRKQGLI